MLNVGDCAGVTNEDIAAVAANCRVLEVLCVARCANLTVAAVAAVAANCRRLRDLDVTRCGLAALPAMLRTLRAERIQITELPRSIVNLDARCVLRVERNPFHTPPLHVVQQGMPAIRRYYYGSLAGQLRAWLLVALCSSSTYEES